MTDQWHCHCTHLRWIHTKQWVSLAFAFRSKGCRLHHTDRIIIIPFLLIIMVSLWVRYTGLGEMDMKSHWLYCNTFWSAAKSTAHSSMKGSWPEQLNHVKHIAERNVFGIESFVFQMFCRSVYFLMHSWHCLPSFILPEKNLRHSSVNILCDILGLHTYVI